MDIDYRRIWQQLQFFIRSSFFKVKVTKYCDSVCIHYDQTGHCIQTSCKKPKRKLSLLMHLNSLFPCTIASRRYHHSNICSRLSITTSVCQLSSIWTTTGASYKFVLNARFRMLQQLLFMVFHHRCNKSQALHHSSVNKQNLSGSAGVLALFLLLFFIYFSVDSFIILFSAFLETKRWRYERRRREYRGAEGGGVWGGVSLSPPRDGSEEGAVPPQIFFHFGA